MLIITKKLKGKLATALLKVKYYYKEAFYTLEA